VDLGRGGDGGHGNRSIEDPIRRGA
jgi:hypothetical protein